MRHADVENPGRVLYGHLPGFYLSALGRAQAAAVGQSLRDRAIKRIVHSPLERAQETAQIVNAQLPAPVPLEVEPALWEAEFSRYLQGVPFWQIPIRRPRWVRHKLQRGALAGDESIETLGGRVLNVVHRLAREHPGEVSLCISHADPLQAAWILLDGRPPPAQGIRDVPQTGRPRGAARIRARRRSRGVDALRSGAEGHSRRLSTDGVALHAPWVRRSHQLPGFRILACDRQPAERPRSIQDQIVTALTQPEDRFQLKPVFGMNTAGI